MSDEKKLKDLIRRLVAMTPEPPPFPEEVPMARHVSSTGPRPALVFAGAAALVIALAVPLLIFFRGSSPEVVATTTTVAPVTSTTPQQESTTTTVQGSTTTAPVPYTWEGLIYLTQQPENSYLGNPALIPLWIQVNGTADVLEDANFTEALSLIDIPPGFTNAIPSDVRVLGWELRDDGVLNVEMNEAFLDGAGGLLADFTMLNQLIYTLTFEESDSVLFLVDGLPVTQFGSEGLDLSDSVDRSTFIDELALIFITDPIIEAENVYIVSGMANTFEATLNVRVIDIASGETLHEEFTTATCGSGCWGEFGAGISSDLVTPGESAIQVLDYSAKDGSPQDVITIPIPADNVWSFTLGG